jgi:DNA-binding CsgD family transcriptional regulator
VLCVIGLRAVVGVTFGGPGDRYRACCTLRRGLLWHWKEIAEPMTENATGRATVRPDVLDLLASGEPPAFVVDHEHRITFWNKGAARVLGRSAAEALGASCHEVLQGRDVFGNRFCHPHCSVSTALRHRESVCGFDMAALDGGGRPLPLHVAILSIPGSRPELFAAVHILQVARDVAQPGQVPEVRPAQAERRSIPASPPLTLREEQVLDWIAAGLQNKEIAHRLGISPATVRNHVHSVLEKLGVHSKLEAISLALRNGWSRDPQPATGSHRGLVESLAKASVGSLVRGTAGGAATRSKARPTEQNAEV